MVRQARSEATRRKIITSAVELFNEIGYPATGLGDIIERAEMTKGALYYHFDSKESLATAIIEEGSANLIHAFRSITESSAPTLESMIHGAFVVADLLSTDKVARSGTQLLRAFGEFNDAAATHVRRLAHRDGGARTSGDRRGRPSRGPRSRSGRRNHRRRNARRGTAVERHVRPESTCWNESPEPGRSCCPPSSATSRFPTSASSWRARPCGMHRGRRPSSGL